MDRLENCEFFCHRCFRNDVWDFPQKKSLCLTLWPSAVQPADWLPRHQGTELQGFLCLPSRGSPHFSFSARRLHVPTAMALLRRPWPLVSHRCAGLSYLQSLLLPNHSTYCCKNKIVECPPPGLIESGFLPTKNLCTYFKILIMTSQLPQSCLAWSYFTPCSFS